MKASFSRSLRGLARGVYEFGRPSSSMPISSVSSGASLGPSSLLPGGISGVEGSDVSGEVGWGSSIRRGGLDGTGLGGGDPPS
jgi:hypothetical protein